MIYELVMLDLDDTVFDYGKSEEYALRKLFSGHGIPYGEKTADEYRRINRIHWKLHEKGLISTGTLRTERFRELLASFGINAGAALARRVADDYILFLSEAVFFESQVQETIEYIRSRHRIAYVSNGIHEVQASRLARAGLGDVLVTSGLAGCAKPDPEMFRFAMRLCGVDDPRRTVMIGDSKETDIAGARSAGIHTVWYNRRGESPCPEADFEIKSLGELVHIL